MNDKTGALKNLTERFEANCAQYMSASYDEANTRTDFIDRLFELLDWDVRNEQGFSETYRDVVREDKVLINGQMKAPDYSFRVGGTVKFYVEAKRPSVHIKDNSDTAYQVRRYAWTKKLPLSILCNFAEFAVYDTRIKPYPHDSVSAARIFYCTFCEYERHFDFISGTFSKNAILKGSFDKYAEENKNKKGTSEVDSELLNLVEAWRVELAKNIALRNNGIGIYNLNTAVQKIIDRIIFLRIAEDKGIEDADSLKGAAQGKNIYGRLNRLFDAAHIKYNSGLFKAEKWLAELAIDDKALQGIIAQLYYPLSPYEFSVLPIEILGNIYEKFLGKMIYFRGVKGGHTAVIEEKPEVRKAGGVYYTPQYVVDYIVRHTVGALTAGKTPEEIAALRFVDPACGSGSFLAGAYQHLLNEHLDYYRGEKHLKTALKQERLYEAARGAYKLTIAEKQRILQNNIYGADIDSHAVEVTKLSLYLKLLESEGREAEGQLFKYSDTTLLPSLENNIKCGNSLIGTDFYAQGDLGLTEEERFKVNCFDWEREFPEAFKGGGFDAVIGNPPYNNYSARNSMFAYYLNNKMKSEYALLKNINDYCKEKYKKSSIGVTDLYKWFLEKTLQLINKNGRIGFIVPDTFEKLQSYADVRGLFSDKYQFKHYGFGVFKDTTVSTGIITYPFQKKERIAENLLVETGKTLIDVIHFKEGEHIPRKELSENTNLIPVVDSKDMGRFLTMSTTSYYKEKSAYKITEGERIIIRKTGYDIIASIITGVSYVIQNLYQSVDIGDFSIFYILGLLNSKFLTYYYRAVLNQNTAGVFAQFRLGELNKLPIPALDLSKPTDKAAHDNLVALVDKMLTLKKREHGEPNPQAQTVIARQIGAADRQIDEAVYALYGLTESEIKIVEGK